MNARRTLWRDEGAATAAEFALVLPLLLLFLFGIIDTGRFLWHLNRAEKATQMGVRFAAVTNMVPSALAAYKFTTGTQVPAVAPGVPVPTSSFDSVSCQNGACTTATVGPTPGFDATAFNNIGNRMRAIYPAISNADFTVTYRNVGLGYAGDPYGPDVSPQVTVLLRNLQFQPITSLLLARIPMPAAASSMTLEDGVGSQSN